MLAIIGNFGFHPNPKGIGLYTYDPATAAMTQIETAFDDVNVGHQWLDAERKIIYLTNERPSLRGQTGGGGYLMALSIDPESGKLALLSEKPTLLGEPCYICVDNTRRYLMVAHHADSGFVSKIVKDERGFSSVTVFDDTALVLFRLNDDGSPGEVCDVALTPGDGASGPHTISHQHSVIADPSGELFFVCDKGLDKIHTFGLDRANGKLIPRQATTVETGLAPRYSACHPSLPILYVNFERKLLLNAYRYDFAGNLEQVGSAPLLLDEESFVGRAKVEAADLLIHPDGKRLYASVRGANLMSVLDVDEAGALSLRENIDCDGDNPRGLAFSPDLRFLFAANIGSGTVTALELGPGGSLTPRGVVAQGRCPANVRILTT